MLTDRQKAQEITAELARNEFLFVVSPPSEPRMRFHVGPFAKPHFLRAMAQRGLTPAFIGQTTRTSPMGLLSALFEIWECDASQMSTPSTEPVVQAIEVSS